MTVQKFKSILMSIIDEVFRKKKVVTWVNAKVISIDTGNYKAKVLLNGDSNNIDCQVHASIINSISVNDNVRIMIFKGNNRQSSDRLIIDKIR